VTVFKGTGGAYQVLEEQNLTVVDGDTLWMVDKIVEDCEIIYEDGESHHKTIHPRGGTDRNVGGSYKSKVNAMHAARKWAGVPEPMTHPVPNRRAAIAHTRAKS
jgi:hypothetical protein